MPSLNLPGLDSEIARHPEFQQALRYDSGSGGPRRAAKRLHLSKVGGGTLGHRYDGQWEWAVLLRAVSGWEVIAHGTDVNTGTPKTHAEVFVMIAEQCYGEDGDGFDRLAAHAYTQVGTSRTAHIRYPGDVSRAYCGQDAGTPAVFDTAMPRHAEQICIDCDAAYRAQNWGRTPVQA